MNQHLSRTTRLGVSMVLAALALLGWLASADDVAWQDIIRSVAIILAVNGVGVITYAAMRSRGRSIEEAYRLGYDVGYENGFRTGYADQASDMVRRDRHHPAADDPGLRNGR